MKHDFVSTSKVHGTVYRQFEKAKAKRKQQEIDEAEERLKHCEIFQDETPHPFYHEVTTETQSEPPASSTEFFPPSEVKPSSIKRQRSNSSYEDQPDSKLPAKEAKQESKQDLHFSNMAQHQQPDKPDPSFDDIIPDTFSYLSTFTNTNQSIAPRNEEQLNAIFQAPDPSDSSSSSSSSSPSSSDDSTLSSNDSNKKRKSKKRNKHRRKQQKAYS